MERTLAAHGDDMFALMSYAFNARDSEFDYWPAAVTDAVFEVILKQCESIPVLCLLYTAMPGAPKPGMDENYHQRVIEKMVDVAGSDLRKLCLLRLHFFKIKEFRSLIEMKINEVAKK